MIENILDKISVSTYVVKTEAEVEVLKGFNKMLLKAGKAPVRIIKVSEDSLVRCVYNFFHKLIVG